MNATKPDFKGIEFDTFKTSPTQSTPLGDLPADWQVVFLDNYSQRGTGHTPSKKFSQYYAGNIVWISLADSSELDSGEISSSKVTISEEGIKHSSAKIHPCGTVLLSRDAGVGKSAIAGCDLCVSQHFITWTCDEKKLHNWFLYYWLQLQKPVFERIAVGSTIKTIGLPFFRDYKIPLPPLGEQRAIADALGDIDAWIGAQEALLAKKRDLKTATMAQLLTGQIRLAGFDGDWQTKTFAEAVKHKSGNSTLIKGKLRSTPSLNLYPAYSASGQDVWHFTYEEEGDAIVVSAVGSRCGKSFLASGKWSAIANTHVIRPISAQVDTRFIHLYLNDENFWVKGGSGQPFILFRQSLSQTLELPPLDEQMAIAGILSGLDEELAALGAQLDKTRQLKAATMTALLSGARRLV